MVVLYLRDHGDFGFPSLKFTQKPASQLHPGTLAGIAKPKSPFSTILKASNKLLGFKNIYIQCNLLLTNCLMSSGKRKSITAKAICMGLIFSLFEVVSSRDMPLGILQYVQCTHHLSSFLSCFFLLTAESVNSR